MISMCRTRACRSALARCSLAATPGLARLRRLAFVMELCQADSICPNLLERRSMPDPAQAATLRRPALGKSKGRSTKEDFNRTCEP